ncbi:MAG: signal peptide peptidase SppA [Deltaproteobacteria bacterium]|nr:MAG: signal peptide peptidase SppA [Deltaproteobacteria bacterium]
MKHVTWFLCVVFLVVAGCAIVKIPLFPSPQGLEEQVLEGEGQAKILLMDISDVISEKKKANRIGFRQRTSLVARIKEIQKAEKDKAVVGIIVRINSPGGTVAATDTIYHELVEFKKRTGARIIACVTGLAVSGGYYVASVADEIIAHPTAITGNIGVIAMKFNVEQLLSKVGVQEEIVKSADKKDIWSPLRPSTPEETEIIQTVIDALHERFVEVVYAGRRPRLSKEEVERLADGRIFTAEQALEVKLVDRIGYLDDAVKETKSSLKLKEAKVVTYHRPGSYRGTIYSGFPQTSDNEINLIAINGDLLSLIPEVQFMYLWRP